MKTLKCFLPILLSIGLFLAGCSDQPSAVVEEENIESQVEVTGFALNNAATTSRQTFTLPPPPFLISAPCLELGEPLEFGGGQVSGWIQTTQTENGHMHINEYLDFSEVEASGGGWNWAAGPGAHEIWNLNFKLPFDPPLNITHEGHSRFVGQGGAPDFILEHRIHQVMTANGELVVNEITPLSVRCIGNAR